MENCGNRGTPPFPSLSSSLPSFPFELVPLTVARGLGVGLAREW